MANTDEKPVTDPRIIHAVHVALRAPYTPGVSKYISAFEARFLQGPETPAAAEKKPPLKRPILR